MNIGQTVAFVKSKACSITILLPSTPVDFYVGGKLIRKGASHRFEMETPDLPSGSFKYTMEIKDPVSTRTRIVEVRGIRRGGEIEVDLTSFEASSPT